MNFLNQKPCIPSWPGVFQFEFFRVVLSKSMCISAFGPSSSSSNSLVLIIHSAFLLGLFVGFFDCALFGCVVFPFSEVGGSLQLGYFSLLIPDVTGTVLLFCSLFIFLCISCISMWKKNFFIIILTWSASLWFFCLKTSTFLSDLYHCFHISSLGRVAPKIAV